MSDMGHGTGTQITPLPLHWDGPYWSNSNVPGDPLWKFRCSCGWTDRCWWQFRLKALRKRVKKHLKEKHGYQSTIDEG